VAQYPVPTGALKNFSIVQMNLKRWLNAHQKYWRSLPGTSRASVPRRNIEACLSDYFVDLARAAIRFYRTPGREAFIGGHHEYFFVSRRVADHFHVLRIELTSEWTFFREVRQPAVSPSPLQSRLLHLASLAPRQFTANRIERFALDVINDPALLALPIDSCRDLVFNAEEF
jgi:hypothetical protein